MTTIEQLGGLTAQYNEIIRRVVNGSLDPIAVKRALLGIVEGTAKDIVEGVPKNTLAITLVRQQLNAWKKLGVAISDERQEQILQQAAVFDPMTESDVPLVTGGFGYANPTAVVEKLFNAFAPPRSYRKYNYIKGVELRYTPGMKPSGEIRLVHYDPNGYASLNSLIAFREARRDKLRLASVEVLEHLVLTPESSLTWDGRVHYYPTLSGLQRKYDDEWCGNPYLGRWDDRAPGFKLTSNVPENESSEWASPVVREC